MNQKEFDKKNVNRCRFCNKEIQGCIPTCSCIHNEEKMKLWSNSVRRRSRVKLVNRLPKLSFENS